MPLSRRSLIGSAAAGSALAALPWRLALADGTTDKRFVLVVLRGGLDGLAAFAPYGDPNYRSLRDQLALDEPGRDDGLVDLGGFFGLHPALAPLAPCYQAGEMLAVHAVATPYRERSHFDAQDLLENGTARPHGSDDGWLNRALALLGSSDRRLGLAVGHGVPLVLRGNVDVANWQPSQLPAADPSFHSLVAGLYRNDAMLAHAYEEGLRATAMAEETLDEATMRPGRRIGRQEASTLLAETAGRMLADPAGPRVAVLEVPGWDTHAGQGTVNGRLATALRRLAESLTRLREGLGPVWPETAIAVVTEFGRTAGPNGSGGTDHGTGTVAMLLGGAVAGGRMIADWPGLSTGALYEGRDLAPTMDLRAFLKGTLRDHLGLPESSLTASVFPGSTDVAAMNGLITV